MSTLNILLKAFDYPSYAVLLIQLYHDLYFNNLESNISDSITFICFPTWINQLLSEDRKFPITLFEAGKKGGRVRHI